MNQELKYLIIAKALNDKYCNKLRENKLHFRGNLNSFSLISLSRNTPESGISALKKEEEGERALKYQITAPKRSTREKELQAWIINYALNNKNILPFLKTEILYITSELALKNNSKEKVVCDILGIDKENNLIVIELKSERLKVLQDQVNNYSEIIKTNKDFFSKLVSVVVGKKWSTLVKGLVVWPSSTKKVPSEWENNIIEEVCYPEFLKDGKKQIEYNKHGEIIFQEYLL